MHDCFGHSSAMMESSEPANSEFSMTICGDERGLRTDLCVAWTRTAPEARIEASEMKTRTLYGEYAVRGDQMRIRRFVAAPAITLLCSLLLVAGCSNGEETVTETGGSCVRWPIPGARGAAIR